MSVLDDYKERERMWPCIMNESVGVALELRNGSREVVRQIENIGCSPSLFIKEWREQPILMRIRKIVSLYILIFLFVLLFIILFILIIFLLIFLLIQYFVLIFRIKIL